MLWFVDVSRCRYIFGYVCSREESFRLITFSPAGCFSERVHVVLYLLGSFCRTLVDQVHRMAIIVIVPKGPCSYVVYTCALKGYLCPGLFLSYLCTIYLHRPLGYTARTAITQRAGIILQ